MVRQGKEYIKIPWKIPKTGYCLGKHPALFRAWAIFKRRYKGDNLREASTWKINFRCMLLGAKIEEIPELEHYPHCKVFQISSTHKIDKTAN